ncbi:MMPL family transporter [Streptomyces sp. V3I8]|uniref:MMPL family transporter n=1 Tax=Streptomyces sp. V3I8 TaxID=3042279 RepID=UPI0027D7A312|nr:MMPL family transporter [Streptomyces sp. V3I8]
MFGPFSRFRAHAILAVAALCVLLCALVATMTSDRLTAGGMYPPSAASVRAERVLGTEFRAGDPDVLLLVEPRDAGQPVDAPAVVAAGRELTGAVRRAGPVHFVSSFWGGNPAMRAGDGRSAVIAVKFRGDEKAVGEAVEQLFPSVLGRHGPVTVSAAGPSATLDALQTHSRRDLIRAELLTAPLVLLLLIVVFRSLLAALLPVLVGVVSVTTTSALLGLLATVTPVSVFALNIASALGFGLAVDYSLFVVTRFRSELDRGADPAAALRTTTATAGRTVVYSAVAVSLSLAALLVFPTMFLRTVAYGGITVTMLSALAACVVLPAALALLGRRAGTTATASRDRDREDEGPAGLPVGSPVGGPVSRATGLIWSSSARLVRRAPASVAVAVTVFLVTLAAPFPDVSFGFPDDRALPAGTAVRAASDRVRADFPQLYEPQIAAVLPGAADGRQALSGTDAYARSLSRVPGVRRVEGATGTYTPAGRQAPVPSAARTFTDGSDAWLRITLSGDRSDSEQALRTLKAVREVSAPVPALMGGGVALLQDTRAALADRLPVAVLWVAVSMFVLLFAFTGSVLIPLKALALTGLSMSAALGMMVFIFQDGHLRDLVGPFTPVGSTDIMMPILVIAIAFGLSMDYEVFLLSAFRESYLVLGDNSAAVEAAVRRTAPLITSAAALIIVVFLGQASSPVVPLKIVGVGMVVTVVLDVTVIRILLAPALMHLAGRTNWWAPPVLARLHARYGLAES